MNKFTREDALKIAEERSNYIYCKEIIAASVAEQVYDACQKAFEEERQELQNRLDSEIEINRNLRGTAQAIENRLSKELKIANGIVASRNQEVETLRDLYNRNQNEE